MIKTVAILIMQVKLTAKCMKYIIESKVNYSTLIDNELFFSHSNICNCLHVYKHYFEQFNNTFSIIFVKPQEQYEEVYTYSKVLLGTDFNISSWSN